MRSEEASTERWREGAEGGGVESDERGVGEEDGEGGGRGDGEGEGSGFFSFSLSELGLLSFFSFTSSCLGLGFFSDFFSFVSFASSVLFPFSLVSLEEREDEEDFLGASSFFLSFFSFPSFSSPLLRRLGLGSGEASLLASEGEGAGPGSAWDSGTWMAGAGGVGVGIGVVGEVAIGDRGLAGVEGSTGGGLTAVGGGEKGGPSESVEVFLEGVEEEEFPEGEVRERSSEEVERLREEGGD